MRKFFSRIEKKRLGGIGALALVLMLVSVGVFGFGHAASAANNILGFLFNETGAAASKILGGTVAWIVQTIGWMLLNFIWVLLAVGNYNQFLASTAVTTGWVVVRDFVNMFFVLVLLAIAIGTILQQQQYHYSQTLPKFLAAAILVNFSKTICGIAIDAAQVVMMTFMGAISAAGGGNFAVLIGLHQLLKTVIADPNPVSGTAAATGMLLAFFYVVVAFVVVVIMVVMLVIRIVALWFLIILSPAAFFLMSLPHDRGYFSKWLDQFINYLLLGPVMAFFLWLSLTVVATQMEGTNDGSKIYIASELGLDLANKGNFSGAVQFGELGGSLIGTLGGTASYILGIVMLLGSLMAAQQLASVGGNVAGAGAAFAKDWMAGKRGPFSPFRGLRERGAAYMKIRRQEREQRINRDAARMAQVVGIAKKLPGQGVRRAGREIYARSAGVRGVHAGLGQVSSGIDQIVNRFSFGQLGWGKAHQDRLSERKRVATAQASARRTRAADHMRRAERLDHEARQEQLAGNPGLAATRRAQATAARAQAHQQLNRAEHLETRNVLDSIQMAMPRITMEIGKAWVASQFGMAGMEGMAGMPGMAGVSGAAALGQSAIASAGIGAIYGPGVMTDLQRNGESQTLAAAEALDGTIGRLIREMQRLPAAQRNAIANRTTPGHSDLEVAAAKISMSQDATADGYANNELAAQLGRFVSLINAHPVEVARWGRQPAAPAATAEQLLQRLIDKGP